MPFAIKPILPIEICSVICPCHFHHNSVLPVNELSSWRKNWLEFPAACPQFAIFVGQAMFTHTTSAGPRSPDCLSRRRFTARGKSQPRCTCKPTEIVPSQSFKTKYGNFCLRRQSRRRRPPSWMRQKVTESRTQTLPSLVSSLPILY